MDAVTGQGRVGGGQQGGLHRGGRADEIDEEGVAVGPASHDHQHGLKVKAPLGLLQGRKIQPEVVFRILQIHRILIHQTEHPEQQVLFPAPLTLDRFEKCQL